MSKHNAPGGFDQLGLSDPVLAAVREVGYESPSPIQLEAIGPLLEGRDVLGQAQTGTGKTAAFALPVLSRLDLSLAQPQVLVLAPTRELAGQVSEAMQTYARHLKGFQVLPVYGGQGMDLQLRMLRRGVHAVVGTPGRIQDHLRRGTLKLDRLTTVVIDEADEMLRMGFIDDVEDILKQMPEHKQVALFSATMPERIRQIAHRHLVDPVEIKIQTKTVTVASVTQRYWPVRGMHKLDALARILEMEDFDAMLIFVRTRVATMELAEQLQARGFATAPLNGDITQPLRERTVEGLRNGKLDIVVATDVAARGLDVDRISHVVNYDIPNDVEAYVHRIGRTGRAGRKGHAILFVAPRERRMLEAIERATRQPIEAMQLPTREDVIDRRTAKFKQTINEVIATQDLSFFSGLVESYQHGEKKNPLEVAAALAYLAQRDRPLLPPIEPQKGKLPRGEEPRGIKKEGRGARQAQTEQRKEQPRPGKKITKPVPEGSVRYVLAVGLEHGVQPSNIVGAIANEAGIESQHIGQIKIYDNYSTVDLPEGMPKEIYRHLQKAWVCGQRLAIRVDGSTEQANKPRKPRKSIKADPGPKRARPKAKKPKGEKLSIKRA